MRRENERKYSFTPAISTKGTDKQERFELRHLDGSTDQYSYIDLKGSRVNAEGTTLTMSISYAPMWVCHGRNLHDVHALLRGRELAYLPVFREGFHAAHPADHDPVITAIVPVDMEKIQRGNKEHQGETSPLVN